MTISANAELDSKDLAALLCNLGRKVRQHLIDNRDATNDHKASGFEGGDTIFAIDRKVEPIIVSAIEHWPDCIKPLLVVAEGFGSNGELRFGNAEKSHLYSLLIDPIDGTRNLMYDKRSAWFLATIAPNQGEPALISHSMASVMIELPVSKQLLADMFVFAKGHALSAVREHTVSGETSQIIVRPSQERSLQHGFAHVSNFFPGTKELAAELMERIAKANLGGVNVGQAAIFDDQYISTGGQLVELIVGHDRFCCDLRPLFYEILQQRSSVAIVRGLECHPYDIAGLPIAKHAGVILTDGFGAELDAAFSVSEPVHWCGYANEELRLSIQPVIDGWLHEKFGGPTKG